MEHEMIHPPRPAGEAAPVGREMSRRHFGKAALAASAGFLLPRTSFGRRDQPASQPTPSTVKNIVLVHGAWADGSSWSRVIPLLEAQGLYVTAVQIPLTSLADDVATTRRALARQNGPAILVGHSYAGFVVTEAGNAPNVAGLVYVSSYGPDEGESHDDLVKRFPAPPGVSIVRLDEDGFFPSSETSSPKCLRRMWIPLRPRLWPWFRSRSPRRCASVCPLPSPRGNLSLLRFCFQRTTAW